MNIDIFVAALREQNIRLWVEGENLRCSGPRGMLTPDLRTELAKHKAEIVAFLHAVPAPANAPTIPAGKSTSNRPASSPTSPYQFLEMGSLDSLNAGQQSHLRALTERYTQRTARSKQWIRACRPFFADYDSSAWFRQDTKEMLYYPVAERALGSKFWDVDGNEYLDFGMGFGVNLLGHSPACVTQALEEALHRGMPLGPHWHLVDQVAHLICELTGMDRVTFLNSGTEAVMGALRLARTITGRTKIAIFAGSYHGWSADVLVKYQLSGGELHTIPSVPGVPEKVSEDVLVLNYGTPEALEMIKTHAPELAAVLVEPVQSRRPDLQPREFLHALRQLTTETNMVLIFDEVLTGFRIHQGGAQAWFDVKADVATYGKIVGGGLPIGAIAGRSRFMDAADGGMWNYGDDSRPQVANTLISGTFSRHPLCMAAALALLTELKREGPALQQRLNQRTADLVQQLNDYFVDSKVPIQVVCFGSLFRFTAREDILDYLYYHLVEKGVFVGVSHNFFLSTAHSDEDLAWLVRAVKESVAELHTGGFLPNAFMHLESAAESHLQTAEHSEPRGIQTLPLTEIQRDYWLATHLGSEVAHASVEGMFLRLQGPLNVAAVRRTFQKIVNRHGALRTTFDAQGEYQYIAPALTLDMPVIDLSHLNPEEREAQVADWMVGQSKTPFDLVNGPLFRCHILKLGPLEHLLCPMAHHLVMDGWSTGVLFKELVDLYPGECQDRPAQLPAPMQYEEYLRWQECQQQGPKREADKAFWLAQFSDSIPVLELPTDRPRPKIMTYAGAREHKRLAASLVNPLKKWSGQHGATLFMTVLAAYAVFLNRLTGRDDLVIGVPSAMRTLRGSENLMGYCTNIMPIRLQMSGNPKFTDFLISTRRMLLACYEHADYPFGALVRELNPVRDPSRLPLVAVTFNLDRRVSLPPLADLTYDLVPQPISSTQYDFVLDVLEVNEEFQLDCFYKTDLFDRETIQRWMDYLGQLLQSVIENPELRISALSLLSIGERQRQIVTWNATQTEYPRAQCISELFEAQVQCDPNAAALVFEDQQLSYRELNRRANQLAHYLSARGVGPDVLVGVCLDRSPEMIVALLGILKAGGAYVPLDPLYPRERLAFMLEDSRVQWLLTQGQVLENLPQQGAETICLDRDWEVIARERDENLASCVRSENLAYVMYTSGSTGTPKGIGVTQRNVVRLVKNTHYADFAQQTFLQYAPISFDAATFEIWGALLNDGCLAIPPAGPLSLQDLSQLIEAHQVTTVWLTAGLFHLMVDEQLDSLRRCRQILAGGDILSVPHVNKALQAFGTQCHLINGYGPTENTTFTCCYSMKEIAHLEHTVPIGRPIANTTVYILDRELQPVPIGVWGELYTGGDGVARGYLQRPDLTAAQFIPDPFSQEAGARLYKTGDLARYLPDGNIEFLGRRDQQIKIRGFRIELGEIEAVLNQHPAVREAVVIASTVAREDLPDHKRLTAYLSLEPEATLTVADLRLYLQGRLPDYMLPASMVLLQALPLTPNGKIDRRALAAASHEDSELIKTFVAPQTPLEQVLAEIWAEVLDVEQVGVTDNFFELGGHSLLATQLISRLGKIFPMEIPLRALFEEPTIAGLAAALLSDNVQRNVVERTAEMLLRVDDLSEDQVDAELAQRAMVP